jgi:ubiquinone/menaquinone biosynthesis C-methylase UbiE
MSVQFDQGFSNALPYPAGSFNRVFSSFMFHHMPADQKEKTLREVRRVLAPGGSLHMLDFDWPDQPPARSLAARIHPGKHLKDNSESQALGLMQQAGLVNAKKVMARTMLFGLLHIGYYIATAPDLAGASD